MRTVIDSFRVLLSITSAAQGLNVGDVVCPAARQWDYMVGCEFNLWLRFAAAQASVPGELAQRDPFGFSKMTAVDFALFGTPPVESDQMRNLLGGIVTIPSSCLCAKNLAPCIPPCSIACDNDWILIVPFHSELDGLRIGLAPLLVFCYSLVSVLLIVRLAASPLVFWRFGIGVAPALSGIAFMLAVGEVVLSIVLALFFWIGVRHTVNIPWPIHE